MTSNQIEWRDYTRDRIAQRVNVNLALHTIGADAGFALATIQSQWRKVGTGPNATQQEYWIAYSPFDAFKHELRKEYPNLLAATSHVEEIVLRRVRQFGLAPLSKPVSP